MGDDLESTMQIEDMLWFW